MRAGLLLLPLVVVDRLGGRIELGAGFRGVFSKGSVGNVDCFGGNLV